MTTRIRIRRADLAASLAAGLMLGAIITGLAFTADDQPDSTMPACVTEDDDNCRWDADVQGNGTGRSFTVVNGVVTYDDEAGR